MCIKPLNLTDRIVKCGQCIECLIARSAEWAFRLEQEQKDASTGVFLTLTYDDENAIWLDVEEGTFTTLHKPDVQKFLKRVRKAQGPLKNKQDYREKVRYFFCGEYGGELGRAHYHAIIYNMKPEVIKKLDKLWGKGFIKVEDVTPKSIRYVTNYMLLKDDKLEKGRTKPFTTMSKKPILGAKYVVSNYPHHNEHLDEKLVAPKKYRPNLYRVYEKKLFNDQERELLKEKRIQNYAPYQKELEEKHEKLDPLDPHGSIRKEREHRNYILNHRKRKRKL